jgi:hypothetical protein
MTTQQIDKKKVPQKIRFSRCFCASFLVSRYLHGVEVWLAWKQTEGDCHRHFVKGDEEGTLLEIANAFGKLSKLVGWFYCGSGSKFSSTEGKVTVCADSSSIGDSVGAEGALEGLNIST